MAEWKKIIVSGSDASLNSVTVGSQSITTAAATTKISGSFTGSFVGDGSGLTGVSAAGTVSSSAQIDITQTTNYTTFSSSIATKNNVQDVSINALNSATSSYALQTQLQGVASSSSQVKTYLPVDTVSSSTQVVAFLPAGTVSSSAQVDVRSTTGIATLATTGSNTFVGNQTINGSVNVTSGVTASAFKGDGSQLTNIGAASLPSGIVSSSGQISYTGITNIPSGIFSSSAQLPAGTVSSSGQVDYNSITNKLSGVVSSSAQVAPLLPAGTVSSSGQVSLGSISGTTFASSNFTFPQNLTVSGDLFVDGTTTTVNTTNLNIEDRFILVNSGSVPGGNAQGGLVVQDSGASPSGSAFFYTTAGSTNRWGLADNVGYSAASATQTAYMSAVVDMNVAAQSASLATYAKVGNIRVETNGDIFIYSA
jgi:hypothetical protein